jgi:hypothetical protein
LALRALGRTGRRGLYDLSSHLFPDPKFSKDRKERPTDEPTSYRSTKP